MFSFYVNGKEYQEEQDMKLLRFLRDRLHFTSVKDGCSEGACGTCHVLIDGKPQKACIPSLSMMEGRHILTVEGFSEEEKEIYDRAFGEAGAVQCGFCIPGMVISAKGLIDQNPDPTVLRQLMRSEIISAAVQDTKRSLTVSCLLQNTKEKGFLRKKNIHGNWETVFPEWMSAKRFWVTDSIRTMFTKRA